MQITEGKSFRLLKDKQIADLLAVSSSWVRKERFNRRHGLAHSLSIDPIMIGSVPRYRESEFRSWCDSLSTG